MSGGRDTEPESPDDAGESTPDVDRGEPRIGIDTPVPKLPRAKGAGLSMDSIFRIGMLAAMLVAVLALRKPCSEGAANFIKGFEPPPDAGAEQAAPSAPPAPPALPPGKEYIRLRGDETEDELRKKLQGLREPPRDAGAQVPAHDGAPE